jgi:hypothetical protein
VRSVLQCPNLTRVTTSEEWLEGQAERILTRQRSRADTAKLVATFAAGIAAALVASALQGQADPSGWDWVSACGLGLTVVLTTGVVLLDRLEEPDHNRVLNLAALGQWSDDHRLFELRAAGLEATRTNEGIVRRIATFLWMQLVFAVLTGTAAAYSMLNAS